MMLARKKVATAPESQSQVGEDWWVSFLKNRGYMSESATLQTTATPSPEEARVLNDPLFAKFLELLSRDWGQGPGAISNFLKLPQDEKLLYLGAFQNWKESIRKKGIKVNF